jgi:hypothetical protein
VDTMINVYISVVCDSEQINWQYIKSIFPSYQTGFTCISDRIYLHIRQDLLAYQTGLCTVYTDAYTAAFDCLTRVSSVDTGKAHMRMRTFNSN